MAAEAGGVVGRREMAASGDGERLKGAPGGGCRRRRVGGRIREEPEGDGDGRQLGVLQQRGEGPEKERCFHQFVKIAF